MDARVTGTDAQGRAQVELGDFRLAATKGDVDARGSVKVTIRPERVKLEEQGSVGENRIPGMVERVVYVGSTLQVIAHLAPRPTLQIWIPNAGAVMPYEQGTPVSVHLPVDALRVLVDTTSLEEVHDMEEPLAAR